MKKQILLTGIAGITGATLMFIGDMFLYFTSETIDNFETEIVSILGQSSETRLIIGGLIGPLATLLYIIGFYQIYLAVQPTYKKIAQVIFGLLSFGIIYGGSFHSLFPHLGFMSSVGCERALVMAESYAMSIFSLMFIPSLVAYGLIAYLILTRKTYYPKWLVLISPIVLFWLSPLVQLLPQPYLIVIAGGWSNLIFILFFSVSTKVLINQKL